MGTKYVIDGFEPVIASGGMQWVSQPYHDLFMVIYE